MFVRTTVNEPSWDSVDSKNLFDFLNGETGKRLVAKLLFDRPHYGDRLDRLVDSGTIEGYQDALENLFSYCELVKPTQTLEDNYPDIDIDHLWPESPKPE